jgi:hypothetical protein
MNKELIGRCEGADRQRKNLCSSQRRACRFTIWKSGRGGIGLYTMVADGEPRAEIYAAAAKKD